MSFSKVSLFFLPQEKRVYTQEICDALRRHPMLNLAKLFPLSVWQKLFSMQDKLVDYKQTHCLKQNFSETITPIDKRCEMLINL